MKKERVDKLLVAQGLADSRSQAQAYIMSGWVCLGDQLILKPSELYGPEAKFRLKEGKGAQYVSRGGDKLSGALKELNLDVKGWRAMDVGISTGGFTDCLLQSGVTQVFGFDVGHGQLHWKIKNDKRVSSYEGINARNIPEDLVIGNVDMIVVDVSFISLTLITGGLLRFLNPEGLLLALVKPQFEVEKGEVSKGGIVRDPALHKKVIEKIKSCLEIQGYQVKNVIPSTVKGTDGNQEFFILASRGV